MKGCERTGTFCADRNATSTSIESRAVSTRAWVGGESSIRRLAGPLNGCGKCIGRTDREKVEPGIWL
ncbi:hypothetical protein ebA7224 [Aromatoleum aromaticum EbN1]|uniref:Uncharacterized protein n=1 Tax=Aromatoleum aromaticum (strain DSM 19018 / LMG 30748 / EbN1) TaxID=76114 RepID=Q5NXJ3_AROAE|nr:hypothetical protein ebA7224 [Aromatoleum aromaticum EbN1]